MLSTVGSPNMAGLLRGVVTEPMKDHSNESPFNRALQYVSEPFGHFQGLFSHWLQFKCLSFETFTDVTGVIFYIGQHNANS